MIPSNPDYQKLRPNETSLLNAADRNVPEQEPVGQPSESGCDSILGPILNEIPRPKRSSPVKLTTTLASLPSSPPFSLPAQTSSIPLIPLTPSPHAPLPPPPSPPPPPPLPPPPPPPPPPPSSVAAPYLLPHSNLHPPPPPPRPIHVSATGSPPLTRFPSNSQIPSLEAAGVEFSISTRSPESSPPLPVSMTSPVLPLAYSSPDSSVPAHQVSDLGIEPRNNETASDFFSGTSTFRRRKPQALVADLSSAQPCVSMQFSEGEIQSGVNIVSTMQQQFHPKQSQPDPPSFTPSLHRRCIGQIIGRDCLISTSDGGYGDIYNYLKMEKCPVSQLYSHPPTPQVPHLSENSGPINATIRSAQLNSHPRQHNETVPLVTAVIPPRRSSSVSRELLGSTTYHPQNQQQNNQQSRLPNQHRQQNRNNQHEQSQHSSSNSYAEHFTVCPGQLSFTDLQSNCMPNNSIHSTRVTQGMSHSQAKLGRKFGGVKLLPDAASNELAATAAAIRTSTGGGVGNSLIRSGPGARDGVLAWRQMSCEPPDRRMPEGELTEFIG
ncbi:unnamed protein product [Protopolystoma xenopodis]|uniref:Uncharacterized protein n=1 Tax=Protopolystoma xenopodis TaxID=117903 RepID=A0A448WCY0_9PLAT|nr:unnamed protein product [Protopolystoma xenopodis]